MKNKTKSVHDLLAQLERIRNYLPDDGIFTDVQNDRLNRACDICVRYLVNIVKYLRDSFTESIKVNKSIYMK